MNKLTPKAVIFDLGSTLIDYPSTTWEEVSVDCMAAVRRVILRTNQNVPDDEAFYAAYRQIRQEHRAVAAETLVEWTVPQVIGKLLESLGLDGDEGSADRLFDAYYEPVRQYLYVYEDTCEILTRIMARYGVVGLVSNTVFPERIHLEELKRFGLDSLLTFKLFSSTFGLRKPHPDIFYKAANLAGFSPSECVYIGDRYLEDISGPNQIGMPA
ncbi:MAG: HAD family hydrolase, partial [candidate division Zixibacteria bacterium]|nr:HAD family hydrolase [candidate division Zixibacteria bacterium]